MSIGNGQYHVTGAISMAYYRNIYATFFNKDLFDEYSVPYLYDAVNSGKWTIGYQHEFASLFYADLNGNNVADENDRLGFIINHDRIGSDAYWSAFELPILAKDEDGFMVFSPIRIVPSPQSQRSTP